jgi:hypothetical protein
MQFKKLCKMVRRSAWNSWCVIERNRLTQLEIEIVVNSDKHDTFE